MGMYVSFVRMTAQQLERAGKDPDWAEEYLEGLYEADAEPLPEGADVDIQKSWAALDHMFFAAGVPFSIQDGGDTIVMGDCWYYNGWDVDDVARAAKVLEETTVDAMAEHCDAAELSKEEVYPMRHMWDAEDIESLRDDFDALKAFFLATAESGHGAMMNFG